MTTMASTTPTSATIRRLPGLEYLGWPYDVDKEFANPNSVDTRTPLFDIPDDAAAYVRSRTITDRDDNWIPQIFDARGAIQRRNSGEFDFIQADSIDEYQKVLASKSSLSVKYSFFSASVSVAFGTDSQRKETDSYTTIRRRNEYWTIALPWPDDELPAHLLTKVRNDLDGTFGMSPEEVVKKYGGFFVREVVVGASANFHYATNTRDLKLKNNFQVVAKAAVKATVGEAEASTDTSLKEDVHKFNSQTRSNITVVGGDMAGLPSNANDWTADHFKTWGASIARNVTFFDFTPSSLKPIWDLVVDPARKKALEDAFYATVPGSSADGSGSPIAILADSADEVGQITEGDLKLVVSRPFLERNEFWLGHLAHCDAFGPRPRILKIRIDNPTLRNKLLAPPTGFEKVWTCQNKHTCWKPVPPDGFRALGYIFRLNVTFNPDDKPSGDEIRDLMCVSNELLVPGALGDPAWCDRGSGGDPDLSLWRIRPKYDDGAINEIRQQIAGFDQMAEAIKSNYPVEAPWAPGGRQDLAGHHMSNDQAIFMNPELIRTPLVRQLDEASASLGLPGGLVYGHPDQGAINDGLMMSLISGPMGRSPGEVIGEVRGRVNPAIALFVLRRDGIEVKAP